jgi:hypothetical protein
VWVGGWCAYGDGQGVDVAEEVEQDLLAVGRDVDVHPRALVGGEGERARVVGRHAPRRVRTQREVVRAVLHVRHLHILLFIIYYLLFIIYC